MKRKQINQAAAVHVGAIETRREALAGLPGSVLDQVEQIRANRYLSRRDKELAIEKVRDDAKRKVEPATTAARDAFRLGQKFRKAALDSLPVDEAARARVQRLVDAGTPIGDVAARALETRSVEMLVALRSELAWRMTDSRLGGKQLAGAVDDAIAHRIDAAIAEVAFAGEAPAFKKLLELTATDDSGGITEAATLAQRGANGDGSQGLARIAYAFATGQDKRERGESFAVDDDGGDDDGGDGGDGE